MTPTLPFRDAWLALLQEPRVVTLARVAGEIPVQLVGGSLRDAALGLPARDLDFVVFECGELVSERFAATQSSRPIRLGGDRFAAFRVPTGTTYVDIWDLQRGDLEADLMRRDLTINAIALALPGGEMSDPSRGCADLAGRTLRRTREGVFHEDVIRVLRLARFARELSGFEIEPTTAAEALEAAPSILEAPPERVRAELDLLFRASDASKVADLLSRLGIGETFGLPDLSALPASVAARRLAECCDRFACSTDEMEDRALLWALLAAQPVGDAREAEARLRKWFRSGLLSRSTFAAAHRALLPPWEPPTDVASLRRWLHFAGDGWRAALALRDALAVGEPGASSWEGVAQDLLALDASLRNEIIAPPQLVTGLDVREILGYPPGPAVGEALARLRRLQVEGSLRTREDALDELRRHVRRR